MHQKQSPAPTCIGEPGYDDDSNGATHRNGSLPPTLRDLLAAHPDSVTNICDHAIRALRELRRTCGRPLRVGDKAPFHWGPGDADDIALVAKLSVFRVVVDDAHGRPLCCRYF